MPAITYEIGGKNTKLRQSLQDSKQAVRDFRQNLKAQTAGMHADAKAAGGGKGIFGAVRVETSPRKRSEKWPAPRAME